MAAKILQHQPYVHSQLNIAELIEHVISKREGCLVSNGALVVQTGTRTGRSPQDRFIVNDENTRDTVHWGEINQPIEPKIFDRLWSRVRRYMDQRESFESRLNVGAHPTHYLPVHVSTEYAWHQLFAQALFVDAEDYNPDDKPEWRIMNAPGFECIPDRDGTKSDGTVMLDFTNRRVLLAGMKYAGEMKKSMFAVQNYVLPNYNILPMHCSANIDRSRGDVALFFGLSGTGKTTLSADPDSLLIGDDEHGWGKGTVFNFEGGCYAKCINLTRESEPLIYDAIRFGAIIENVVIDADTRNPDYNDSSLTENTRACYPLNNVKGAVANTRAGEPKSIIFLTCDISGVLPPVSILSREAAAYHFLSGYTAKVGSTVVGSSEAYAATFSACFGEPFFPRAPRVYSDLLMRRINEFGSKVYLVNTGWTGGDFGSGNRFSIPVTRRIVHAARSGELDDVPTEHLPELNLTIPTRVPGVDSTLLNPRNTWQDKHAYDEARMSLVKKFKDNFARFEIDQQIIDAGPR